MFIHTNSVNLKLEQIEFKMSVCVGVWCMCGGDMCIHHGPCVGASRWLCRVGSFLSPSHGFYGVSSCCQDFTVSLLPSEPSPWLVDSPFLVIFGCPPQGISTACFHLGLVFHSFLPLILSLSMPGTGRITLILSFHYFLSLYLQVITFYHKELSPVFSRVALIINWSLILFYLGGSQKQKANALLIWDCLLSVDEIGIGWEKQVKNGHEWRQRSEGNAEYNPRMKNCSRMVRHQNSCLCWRQKGRQW